LFLKQAYSGRAFHVKYDIPYYNIGVITGPCHAEEVAMERLSYLTIACGDPDKAKTVAKKIYLETTLNKKITDDMELSMLPC
jgi:glycerol-3-phosphate dehydrogenase (NAD(P)+)